MKILFLSFYYPPDLCAGSFRAKALVDALLEKIPDSDDCHIDLMTTMPNRYNSFLNNASDLEILPHLTIHRALLPPHKSGILDQSWAFGAFARQTLMKVRGRKYDLAVATSSRLMTAALGSFIVRIKKIPLYLDIRDIYVDTISDILPRKTAFLIKPLFEFVERFTMLRADKINLVSEGFSQYFIKKYPNQSYSFFTNGIDDEFLDYRNVNNLEDKEKKEIPTKTDFAMPESNLQEPTSLRVLYAGNIGEGQGLHVVLPDLAKRLEGCVSFRIIGDGGRRTFLEEQIVEKNCKNIELLPPMNRENLIQEYMSADILFLHLHAYDAFKKVLPSKIFEYAATGKPVWAGVSGYAAEFIRREIENAAIFDPCDVGQAIEALHRLKVCSIDRSVFVEKFLRKNIMNSMASDILNVSKK